MSCIECFVAAVPKAAEAEYKSHAANMAKVFKEHGATKSVDCWGVDVPDGEVTSFLKAVQAKDDEVVALGWLEWPSKEARDEGMSNAMNDERMRMEHMPFDGKRLIFGGFDCFSEV